MAIGNALAALSTEGGRYVTIGLTCEFLGSASIGDWIETQVTPHKIRGRVVSGSVVMSRAAAVVATAHALFVPT